jgi:predicted DCC family thiol-disulfide oxidoreductase YuxK
MPASKPTLIYDGDCGFCGRCLTWGLRHFMAFPKAIPSKSDEAKASGLTEAQLAESIWIIGAGNPLPAAKAVAFILKMQPNLLWRIAGRLMSTWPVSFFAKRAYFWVAKNRGRL